MIISVKAFIVASIVAIVFYLVLKRLGASWPICIICSVLLGLSAYLFADDDEMPGDNSTDCDDVSWSATCGGCD